VEYEDTKEMSIISVALVMRGVVAAIHDMSVLQ
jgi:hypothetical protein